jgi:type II secretory pathway component GspD/PulD (secretin)
MTPFMRVLAACVIAFTLAAPALAQVAITQPAPGPVQGVGARRVTLDLKDVAPASAFKALADAIGVTVTVDESVTAPVDIKVRNVSAKTALDAMCEGIGCQWTLVGENLAIKPARSFSAVAIGKAEGPARDKLARTQEVTGRLKQKLPADMKFENTPIEQVNARLSEALGLPVRLSCKDPAVQTLTVDLSNQTLQSGLMMIAQQQKQPGAVWQLMIGPPPGDPKSPSIGIMVSPKGTKKGDSKPGKLEIHIATKDEKKK